MKRNKFLHNGFFNYFRALNIGSAMTARRAPAEIWIAIIAVIITAYVLGSMDVGIGDGSVVFGGGGGWLIMCVCYFLGYNNRKKPSTLTLMPVNYRKRTLYFYLSAIVSYILICILFVVFLLVMIALVSLIVLAMTGEVALVLERDSEYAGAVCAQGAGFTCFLWLFVFGGSMIVAHIEKRKARYAGMFAFAALLEVIALVFNNMTSGGTEFTVFGSVAENFENLPISWLWLTCFGLISVGMFVASVLFSLEREKPKDY